ncbi:hypothetical protein V493_03191 [Pseudogymnoascus sp. VKM F-4281 (FW-2241)]|nr:hypothetical protein V493_03191 [Pseudogymnoascus sp. VKM F-4281 (FW-2241)]
MAPQTHKAKPPISEPRPSSSILLISPENQILLLHRVKTSSSFASAHVFPGGNLSSSQDGPIPAPSSPERHVDSPVYRLGAIRECFEESGILLARHRDGGGMLEVPDAERERARRAIHSGELKFSEWVKEMGGVVDADALLPFTRWVTPTTIPRRFTTQMYVYFWPLSEAGPIEGNATIPTPTSDGGLEHTTAVFQPCAAWLAQARRNEIIMFPPQFYLIWLLCKFLEEGDLRAQREKIREFLKGSGGNGVPWADKVMSPVPLGMFEGKAVLNLDHPGPELKGSGRRGENAHVVQVRFSKEGPRDVEGRNSSRQIVRFVKSVITHRTKSVITHHAKSVMSSIIEKIIKDPSKKKKSPRAWLATPLVKELLAEADRMSLERVVIPGWEEFGKDLRPLSVAMDRYLALPEAEKAAAFDAVLLEAEQVVNLLTN